MSHLHLKNCNCSQLSSGARVSRAASRNTIERARTAAQAVASPSSAETSSNIQQPSRREALLAGLGFAAAALATPPQAVAARVLSQPDIEEIEVEAFEAYANREFSTVLQKLQDILAADPDNARWYEMRAQVLVDAKQFEQAVADFNKALQLIPPGQPVTTARLRSGRALAHEGLAQWEAALQDYTAALDLAQEAGESPDAYIINAIGNCQNSLQRWGEARESYLTSSQLFQQAKGFRGRGGTTTQRLDGAIYAASNAALMLAQLGEEEGALKEFEKVSRRAPGSSDTRAALAALYWRAGRYEQAEAAWQFACENITAGCRKYVDVEWLQTVRRWPPVMVAYLQDFLKLQRGGEADSSGGLRTLQAV